jgi:hypothetical protein
MLTPVTETVAIPPSTATIVRETDCAAAFLLRVTGLGQAPTRAPFVVQVKLTVTGLRYQRLRLVAWTLVTLALIVGLWRVVVAEEARELTSPA